MIIISLTYIAPMELVQEHFDAHINWLQKHYEAGDFVASGRKVPRTGGVILAKGSMEDVQAICNADPFVWSGVAEAQLTEVDFSRTAAGLEGLKDNKD